MVNGRPRRIWRENDGTVILRDYDDEKDVDIMRCFQCPPDGGYVREVTRHRTGRQAETVGPLLQHFGVPLTARPDTLLQVIEAEFRQRERLHLQAPRRR